MRHETTKFGLWLSLFCLLSSWQGTALGQRPPLPQPDLGADQHIFYGATPPGGESAPVLVFVHGLRGTASDWWVSEVGIPNDMYEFAYVNGYRTAFVSLSLDNSRNDATIEDNAAVFTDALPKIVSRFAASKVYLICHSKGGLDVQMAMLNPEISGLVRAVFNIATPNTGTELADWAFGPGRPIAERLGLLTPAVEALLTSNVAAFRAQADPILASLGIPFYTMSGRTFRGHPITAVTGLVLMSLRPGERNDGFVPRGRSSLPLSYGIDVGEVHGNHFDNDTGNVSFPKINAHITGLELTSPDFKRVASNGFADFSPDGPEDARFNTWMWSMAWFKGSLYVGTGRAVQCATMATAAAQADIPALYPPIVGDCPEDAQDLPLGAEIWRYTPGGIRDGVRRNVWERVFKSPESISLGAGPDGEKFTARDTGFRGMAVFKEADGSEALYVAGTTSSSIFDKLPVFEENGFPPPRILRSADGENFEPIPHDPGTFLGDIVQNSSQGIKVRGFRSMAAYKNQLFVTGSDFRGVGVIFASDNPAQGNDAWYQVSPSPEELPVWTLKVFNDYLYCTTGDRQNPVGYGVYKTNAQGDPPYRFIPVVTNGAYQTIDILRSPDALSLEEFQGKLYVGSDRPTELIRINPDDSWELVIGHPRMTPSGLKTPISGIGQWAGSYFNGHFWRMQKFDGQLYFGTWDWSQSFRTIILLDSLFRAQYGTDVFRTSDGVHWSFVTKVGFGNPFNYGTRSFQATPVGLFLGTAKPEGGGEVYLNTSNIDFDKDGDVDQFDVDVVLTAVNQDRALPDDSRDLDRDGLITVSDANLLAWMCTKPGCEVITPEPGGPEPPENLRAASVFQVGRNVVLNWDPVPGAVSYKVFRSEVRPFMDLFPPNGIELRLPGTDITVNIPKDFLEHRFDDYCSEPDNEGTLLCVVNSLFQNVDLTRNVLGLPLRYFAVTETTSTSYSEPAPTELQSTYFVVAVDIDGRISEPSNFVGGPSFAIR